MIKVILEEEVLGPSELNSLLLGGGSVVDETSCLTTIIVEVVSSIFVLGLGRRLMTLPEGIQRQRTSIPGIIILVLFSIVVAIASLFLLPFTYNKGSDGLNQQFTLLPGIFG